MGAQGSHFIGLDAAPPLPSAVTMSPQQRQLTIPYGAADPTDGPSGNLCSHLWCSPWAQQLLSSFPLGRWLAGNLTGPGPGLDPARGTWRGVDGLPRDRALRGD